MIQLRHAEPDDYSFVTSVINDWWGGRQMRDMLPKLFFVHFRETSLIAEENGQIVGFLCGFFSQTYSDEAYIHFVGVHPNFRKANVARTLYEYFFEIVRANGRQVVRCVTSPVNRASIAFHQRLGFEIEPGNAEIDGIAVKTNYDGSDESRVLVVKNL